VRNTFGGLRETVMLGWPLAASDIQSRTYTRDRALINGHAEVHARDAVPVEVSGTQYSCFFDKSYHIGDAVIGHESHLY